MSRPKHFIVGLDESVIENAQQNCLRRATTLRKTVERMIAEEAKVEVPDAEAFILETDAVKETWCPSRATLFSMRQTDELKEAKQTNDLNGSHYVVNDGLIFYRLQTLRDYCKEHYPHVEQANLKRQEAKLAES